MRIGKMLIMSDEGMNEAKVFYAKFPPDINKRNVLLMYPIMCTYCHCSGASIVSNSVQSVWSKFFGVIQLVY